VRAEASAHSAVAANDRFICFLIKVYRAHNASFLTSAAANTPIFPDKHTAPGTLFQSVAWAHLHASGLDATEAYDRDKVAGHSAGSTNPDRAFHKRVVFFVSYSTNTHASKATQTLVHVLWYKYL